MDEKSVPRVPLLLLFSQFPRQSMLCSSSVCHVLRLPRSDHLHISQRMCIPVYPGWSCFPNELGYPKLVNQGASTNQGRRVSVPLPPEVPTPPDSYSTSTSQLFALGARDVLLVDEIPTCFVPSV